VNDGALYTAADEEVTNLLLQGGPLAVELAPGAGGSIARLAVDGIDLLRPMAAADVASGKVNNAAAYPLVPFSNRIANGRLVFEGEQFALTPNWPGLRHPMHGDGWACAWLVEKADVRSAEIFYLHERAGERGGWPFRYRARQSYRLTEDRLTVRMALDNLEDRPVPAGIGLHPFFLRNADTELACRTKAVWTADDEVLPIERVAVPRHWDFSASRRVDTTVLDNCFDGWDGRATVTWPGRRLRLALEASQPFRHLVIYVPPGRDFFCVEPVSHANGLVGLSPLGPGATLAGEIVFHVLHL
jgi:aldose 1-epimerase